MSNLLDDIIGSINSTIDYAKEQEANGNPNLAEDVREFARNAAQEALGQKEQQDQPRNNYYYDYAPSASSYSAASQYEQQQGSPANFIVDNGSIMTPEEQLKAEQEELFNRKIEDSKLAPLVEKMSDFADNYNGSMEQLSNIEQEFNEEQEQRKQQSQSLQANFLDQIYDAPTPNADEMLRRFTDENGNVRTNPLDWNIFGFTSQNKTPEAARKLYDWHFNDEDKNPESNIETIDRGEVVDKNAIDDGRSASSREALFMTGEQYLKYRNDFGLPGRDVDKIDPNKIYSKQDEQDQYGFIPYITSDESLSRFHDEAAPHALSNVFNHLANARRENTDFEVDFDGQKMSGKNLIQQGNLWWQRNVGKSQEAEAITDQSKIDENSVPYTYVLTDSAGNEVVAKSPLVNAYMDEEGHPIMVFEDGDVWTFDDQEDVDRSLGERPSQEGDYTAYWKNLEPLKLDDGTIIRADKAEELLNNNNWENYADYGPNNFNKPYIEDPFAEGAFLPWITDVALGSVPYFFKPTAAAQGLGNAAASYTGFNPGYQDYLNGTYSMLSDAPTREQQVSATLGSLAMPITEHLWGNIGSNFISKPLMKALKVNEADINPLIRFGLGSVGEGLEEIPGNIVEPLQQGSGLSGWYANDMYLDENGNLTTEDTGRKAYDSQGHAIKNTDTDIVSRFRNFGEDIPLAFIGGATLGGTLGAPAIKGYYNEYAPRKQERAEFGDNLIRELNPELRVGLTDEEREYYNR